MRLNHPRVGELNLDWDAYPIPGNPGPVLMVCTAADDSPDAERLQLLADRLGAPCPRPAAPPARPGQQTNPRSLTWGFKRAGDENRTRTLSLGS
ncbi:hypothetical protein ACRJ4W_51720 [Streptomyces sp. GLT-R25]